MCGIAGIIQKNGQPVDEVLLKSMCDVIRHRGPDDSGVFVDGAVGLGNTRLSIIDIDGGHQPISTEDGRLWIVCNGELYNYRELRRDLESRQYHFRTQSDTEVVLAAYDVWGVDCVQRFNGIFAFAIWDSKRQRLFVARDHLGVKPFYFYEDTTRFVFGSELKAILQDRSVPRKLDLNALDSFLTYRYVPSPQTLFEGIKKLPPGHSLTLDDSGLNMNRYWQSIPEIDDSITESDASENLVRLFDQAVHRQMVSDVPIGLMLSGGMDSAAVLAVMSKYTTYPVKTFTVGFKDDTDANELEDARATAKLFGAEHHEVIVDEMDFEQFLGQVLWHLEEPLSTTSILPFYYVSELARKHVKVVLTGQGADEPFAGYNRYRGEKLGHYLRKFPDGLQKGISMVSSRIPHRSEQLKRAARSLVVSDPLDRFVEVYSVFSRNDRHALYRPEVSSMLADSEPARAIAELQGRVAHLDSLTQMLYIDTRVWLPDDLLLYGDKLSMAHSLEARVPFLDIDFLEYVETIPAELKLKGLTGKYIHKKAMEKLLPAEIVYRRKKGFATPMDRWLQGDMADYVRSLLLSTESATGEYFNGDTIKNMVDVHASGRVNYQRQIFALLTLELWHRVFMK